MASERPSMMMEKQNSVTMEYFLETSHLDADTAALLKKYDKDGNGSFSKDEVAAIIMDLREAMRSNQELGSSNKLFKRLLIASCVFCVLLLASMFGLSYAVAALTAKTDVDSSGALTKAGSSEHVSTDSRAEVHIVAYNEVGRLCVTNFEIDAIVDEMASGKNVMMETTQGETTTVNQVSGNGMTITQTEKGPVPCFDLGNGFNRCFYPDEECNEFNSSGRRLPESNEIPRWRRLKHVDQEERELQQDGSYGQDGSYQDGSYQDGSYEGSGGSGSSGSDCCQCSLPDIACAGATRCICGGE